MKQDEETLKQAEPDARSPDARLSPSQWKSHQPLRVQAQTQVSFLTPPARGAGDRGVEVSMHLAGMGVFQNKELPALPPEAKEEPKQKCTGPRCGEVLETAPAPQTPASFSTHSPALPGSPGIRSGTWGLPSSCRNTSTQRLQITKDEREGTTVKCSHRLAETEGAAPSSLLSQPLGPRQPHTGGNDPSRHAGKDVFCGGKSMACREER